MREQGIRRRIGRGRRKRGKTGEGQKTVITIKTKSENNRPKKYKWDKERRER
jgi:hypothetical protein